MRSVVYYNGRTSALVRIAAGFFLGILFGFMAAPFIQDSAVLNTYVMPFLELSGKIFLYVLTIIIVPLVFSSLAAGIAGVGEPKKLGRIGAKTLVLYLLTTLIAVVIGMLCAELIKPGTSIDIPKGLHEYSTEPKPLRNIFLDIFPADPAASILDANMLHIIVLSVFCGIACIFTGETGKKAARLAKKAAKIMRAVTNVVMWFAPFGVFALIAVSAADFGLALVKPFAKVIAAVFSGCFLHAGAVYSLMIIFFCKKSPLWFFKSMREAAMTAFATRSSAVTLPVTMEDVQQNLGVSREISSFVLPLGVTLNMDGTAIYQVVCALFVARAFDVPLTLGLYARIALAATLASISTAGVPAAGMVMLTVVLASAGLPVEGVGLVAGIDVVLCSARTVINVLGDAAVCVAVAAGEGEDLTRTNRRGRMPRVNYVDGA